MSSKTLAFCAHVLLQQKDQILRWERGSEATERERPRRTLHWAGLGRREACLRWGSPPHRNVPVTKGHVKQGKASCGDKSPLPH